MTREEAISKLNELIECIVDRGMIDDICYEVIEFLEAQEPRLVTEADFENADEYGFIPAWYEGLVNKEGWWNCIPKEALKTAKEDGCRYWTAKPSLKQMEETPWQDSSNL